MAGVRPFVRAILAFVAVYAVLAIAEGLIFLRLEYSVWTFPEFALQEVAAGCVLAFGVLLLDRPVAALGPSFLRDGVVAVVVLGLALVLSALFVAQWNYAGTFVRERSVLAALREAKRVLAITLESPRPVLLLAPRAVPFAWAAFARARGLSAWPACACCSAAVPARCSRCMP